MGCDTAARTGRVSAELLAQSLVFTLFSEPQRLQVIMPPRGFDRD
jgi:hypothetical protein